MLVLLGIVSAVVLTLAQARDRRDPPVIDDPVVSPLDGYADQIIPGDYVEASSMSLEPQAEGLLDIR